MELDLDKTQEWLNRTQQWSRTPAVRGGVETDHRSRRQAIAGLALVLLGILILALIPRPQPVTQRIAQAPLGPAPMPAGRRDILASSYSPPAVPIERPPMITLTGPPKPGHMFINDQPYFTVVRHRGDHVPPPAPIWLVTKPENYNYMPIPEGSPRVSVLHPQGGYYSGESGKSDTSEKIELPPGD